MRHLPFFGLFLLIGCDAVPAGAPARPDGGGETDDAALMALDLAAFTSAVPDDADTAPATGTPLDAGRGDAARLHAGTYAYQLDAGAYPPTPAHPSALVYVPSSFDPTPPIAIVVYIHGFNNCVENIVRDAGMSCNPDAGTPVRTASQLAAQMETAHKNAILLCPEVAYDQATGAPGNLGNANGFKALLAETLADLTPVLGPRTLADVGRVVLASHSGGYQVAAAIATKGGVPVEEVFLLDSLYGNVADFEAWINQDRATFYGGNPARRFADVYTAGGGTMSNSLAMANWAHTWVPADGGTLVDDRTTATWPDATYYHGLLFKLTSLPHGSVPSYYFGKLVATSGLPERPAGP